MNIKKIVTELNSSATPANNLESHCVEGRNVCAELVIHLFQQSEEMGQAHLLKAVAELAGPEGWSGQVSMSQRQQQQSAVQQAVRQVDGPRSSRLWSSTTYTGGEVERG